VTVLEKNASYGALLAYAILTWIFAACVAAQIALAGLATFTDSAYWRSHVQFVHLFEYLPLLTGIIALFGKIRGKLRWWPFGMLILIALQYATAEMALGRTVAALHPVIAALLFLISTNIAVKSTNDVRKNGSIQTRN
jgi:hypothetical protein